MVLEKLGRKRPAICVRRRLLIGAQAIAITLSAQAASAQVLGSPYNPNMPGGSPLDNGSSSSASGRQSDTTDANGNPISDRRSSSQGDDLQISSTSIEPASIADRQMQGNAAEQNRLQQQSLEARRNDDMIDVRNPRLKPPALPGEYEKWLQDVTGRKLKRFGSDLLLPSNRDYSVPATTTIPPDYALNIGDVVSISLTGSVEGSADFVIDRDGKINVPSVGSISLIGTRYRDLKDRITAAVGRKYRGYDVSVSIARLRGVRVYVTGFANNPGAYTVNSLSTLVNAVLAAGGPSAGGSFRSVKLYRNGREVVDFDLYELLRKGDKSTDPILQNEDVLFIPPVGRQVAVVGSINEEAIYEARPGESVEDMVRIAGGPTNLADSSRLVLYRLSERDQGGSRQIARDRASAELAESGDIIQFLPEGSLARPLEKQRVIVRLEGEVNRPGNYYVEPNTPLSTVLDMAGGLTTRAFVYGTQFSRETVRAQQRRGYREALDQMETVLAAAPLTQDRTIDAGERQSQLASVRAFLTKLRQAEPDGRLVLDLTPDMTTLPGTILLENNDRIVVPPRIDTVGVFGAVYRPASFMLGTGKPKRVRDYVDLAGGTMRAADGSNIFVVHANGEVVTKRRGGLSKYVLPGDVVFVPVKTQSSSLLAKIKDISQIIFQFGITAAAIAAIQ